MSTSLKHHHPQRLTPNAVDMPLAALFQMTRQTFYIVIILFIIAAGRPAWTAPAIKADTFRKMTEEQILKAYDYHLRVRVVNNARRVKLNPQEPCELRDSKGNLIANIKANAFLKIETPMEIEREGLYRVYLEDFSIWEKNPARLMAVNVQKQYQIDAHVITITMRIRHFKDFYPFWNKGVGRKLVVVGGFSDRESARQLADRLRPLHPDARVIFDPREQARRVIRITVGDGRRLGDFSDRVLLVHQSDQAPTYFEALQNDRSSWRLHTRTDSMVRGDFEIYANEWGLLRMVNIVHVEQYLYGVVPVEIYPTAAEEALKAQAVAARSTALFRIIRGQNNMNRFDLVRDFRVDMEYGGQPHEHILVNAAVDATRGEVMCYTDNEGQRRLINAVFCASCGGVTCDSRERWQREECPYLTPRFDRRFFASRPPELSTEEAARDWIDKEPVAFCNPNQNGVSDALRKKLNRHYRWQTRLSQTRLSREVNKQFKVGAVRDMRVASRSMSGRVETLEFTLSDGRKKKTKPKDSEKIAALSFARSLFFYVDRLSQEKDGAAFLIRGAGYGHGVGMCQVGAMGMGERGYTAETILRHYYHDIDLMRLY